MGTLPYGLADVTPHTKAPLFFVTPSQPLQALNDCITKRHTVHCDVTVVGGNPFSAFWAVAHSIKWEKNCALFFFFAAPICFDVEVK